MMDFTLSNCKDLDVSKVTCGITKRFAILLVMMVMITSKALAGASFEVIDGFKYLLDSDIKTATLLPNTEPYAGDKIVIPESVKAKDGNDYKVTAIGDKCFYLCKDLTSITIPSSVTSLGGYCFDGCRSLTSILIPSSVTSLGMGCFAHCISLTSILIPSSVTSIGDQCFSECSGLTSITIPSSVTSLGGYCFLHCSKLESIYFKGKCPDSISDAEIPKACIIYVPAEYLQDYKDALGADYKYIYTWNPNESGDDDKPVTPCATPSVFYGAGKLKFSCETAGAKYHYTISDKDMATDALSEDGNVTFRQLMTYQFMQQLMAILHPKRLRLHYIGSMPTWRMQPTSTRLEPVALWLLPMTESSAFPVLMMARWLSSMQLMANSSAPLLP